VGINEYATNNINTFHCTRALACPARIRLPKGNEKKLGVSRTCEVHGENYQLGGNMGGKHVDNSTILKLILKKYIAKVPNGFKLLMFEPTDGILVTC
jgi:hypothetical protein